VNYLFADTFYFIALLSPQDQAHQRATAIGYSISPRRAILTTAFVLTELADSISQHRYREGVMRLFETVRNRKSIRILPPTEELFDAGLTLYGSRRDKDWSLTDCISFEVMRRFHVTEALTGDKHFEQAGFVALLK
jgi:predicted nucleic acid-binding protein